MSWVIVKCPRCDWNSNEVFGLHYLACHSDEVSQTLEDLTKDDDRDVDPE
jgi:hypothetical protein